MLFILYIADQKRSREFYKHLLKLNPSLDEPGMTEFTLPGGAKIGLMPEKSIARILGDGVPSPASGRGIPRCEIYLRVDNPKLHLNRALSGGARLLSPLQPRAWGDEAAYVADPDGHVIALARTLPR
jgi:catechol 2,3-dioxygenase-like lactoylglutathione lyase family enzyme